MRRLIAGVVAGCATVAVTAVAPPVGAAASGGRGSAGVVASGPQIAWGTCPSATLTAAQVQCGRLQVPLDYRDPTGPQITLAVSRVRHTVPAGQFQGVMLVNPAVPADPVLPLPRPGGGCPTTSARATTGSGSIRAGSARARPALSCLPNYFAGPRPQYVPITDALARSGSPGRRGTRRRANADVRNVARPHEHDRLRPRHGQHPEGARRAADQLLRFLVRHLPRRGLRDAVPVPGASDGASTATSTRVTCGTRRTSTRTSRSTATSRICFGWIAKYDDVYHLGPTAIGGRATVLRRPERPHANIRPVGSSVPPSGTTHSCGRLLLRSLWTGPRRRLRELGPRRDAKPRSSGRTGAADGPGNDNGYAVYLAVQCTDAQWPQPVGHLGTGQLAGLRGTVPHLAKRLVQRAVPVLARPSGHPGASGRRPVRRSC